ncbi:MAG: SusC/RagA family TonB-linked outer membrane protein [Bacteroidales bacterium]
MKNFKFFIPPIFEVARKFLLPMKLMLILFFAIFIQVSATADQQQITVTGRVTDPADIGLPGVTVMIRGTTIGTVTNSEGEYSLPNVPAGAILVFSFVGMQTVEIVVGDQTVINVNMLEDTVGIEEVVAVGYGTLQRNRVSSSIVSVSPERLTAQVTSSFDNSLEGQISGLSVRQTSGAPGGGSELQLRGSGSIGAGDSPLVVVDGVPMQNIYGKHRSPLSMVNQSDIASIDILKGVSATAIYGSRGSNGVILITTKTGRTGVTDFSFTSRAGMERVMPGAKLELMNAEEFARWRMENAFERAAFYDYEITMNDIPEVYRNPEALGEGTDWYDVMTRVAPTQEYNLNVSHGTEDFVGFFSLGFLDNQGTIHETSFDRLTFLANMSYQPHEMLSLGLSLNPTTRRWINEVGGSRTTIYGSAFMSSPLDSPYYQEGDPWERDNPAYRDGEWDLDIWSPGTFSNNNALYALKNRTDVSRTFTLRALPYIEFRPIEGLTLRSQYNIDMAYGSRENFKPSTVTNIFNPPPQPITGYYTTDRNYNWQLENTITYNRTEGLHRINVLGGYSMEHYNALTSQINGSQYPDNEIRTINASVVQTGNTQETNWSMISYLARLNYDYDGKYLMTATVRRDGSSRFGADRRWGVFPSASVGWNINREAWFPSPEWMSNLKLRASYGFSGNNAIGNYTWIPTLAANNYTFGGSVVDGKRVAAMENRLLSWERAREFDTGIELVLFNGRLNFIADYYERVTEDMLWGVALPISSGFSNVQNNIGEIQNRGVELSLSSINVTNNNFTWRSDFNISFNRNEVLSLGAVGRIITGARGYSITEVGQPLGMFYTWEHLGILNTWEDVENYATQAGQVPGTPLFRDTNGDGIIDETDKLILGNPHPDFRGGFTNSLRYGNWDFFVTMSFAHNFDVWAQLEEDVLNLDGVFNVLKRVENRWRSAEEPGDGRIAASFHSTAYNRIGSSNWIYNTSFLKVNNINVGYTFTNLNFGKQLRLHASVQNAFLFTDYPYGNPDANIYGDNSLTRNFHNYDYPLTQSIIFGLEFNF